MKQDNYGMQAKQAETPRQPGTAAAEPLTKQTDIRRKPNAAVEVMSATVIEAEVTTRMRKKMLRKYLIRVGAGVLAATAVFLHFFGASLLALLRKDDMFIRHFRGPVSLEANPELVEMMYTSAMKGGKDFSFDTELLRCNTADQAFAIINASYSQMMEEHPELFFLRGPHPTLYTGGKDNAQLCKTVDFSFYIVEEFQNMPLKKMCSDMEKTAKSIVSQVPKHASDYEKALFVHDYLVDSVTYDIPGSKLGHFDLCFTAYGALENQSAVCQGYACAYSYLMHLMDIDCKVVGGEAKTEGLDKLLVMLSLKNSSHAWNYIELDGDHYWVDVTWDDPLNEDGTEPGGPVSHTFCFVDDDTLFKSHKLDDKYKDLPPCNSMKLNDKLTQADPDNQNN